MDEHPSAKRMENPDDKYPVSSFRNSRVRCMYNLASATCRPPAKAGAAICFPTTNATVVFPMNIEGAATGENGLPITRMILYSNNVKLLEKDNSDTIYLVMDENDYFNQSYNLVLNAWDSGGNLFQIFGECDAGWRLLPMHSSRVWH